MSKLDADWGQCTKAELLHACEAYEFLQGRAREQISLLLTDWENLDDGERYQRLRRLLGASLITPRPLKPKALEALRNRVRREFRDA